MTRRIMVTSDIRHFWSLDDHLRRRAAWEEALVKMIVIIVGHWYFCQHQHQSILFTCPCDTRPRGTHVTAILLALLDRWDVQFLQWHLHRIIWWGTQIFRTNQWWRWTQTWYCVVIVWACFVIVAWLGMSEHVKSWCFAVGDIMAHRVAKTSRHTFSSPIHPYHVLVHTVLLLEPDCLSLWGDGASVLGGWPAPSGVAVRGVHQGGVRHP